MANDDSGGSRGGYLKTSGTVITWYLNGVTNSVTTNSTIVSPTLTSHVDGKWHNIAAVYDNGQHLMLYVDGKLVAKEAATGTPSSGAGVKFYLGYANSAYFTGTIGRVSVWDVDLTQAQIREMMFYDEATADASGTIPDANCVSWYQFDEGTSTTIANAEGTAGNNATTAGGYAWASAGTFDEGTSTLTLTGSSKYLNFLDSQDLNNLTISGSYTLDGINDLSAELYLHGDLNVTGTVTTTDIITLDTAAKSATLSGTTTALGQLRTRHGSGTITIGGSAATVQTLKCFGSGGTTQATASLTCTTELEIASGCIFDANGNTINSAELDVNGGTLNLTNSTLNFATAGQEWNMTSASTLTTGNTTVTGYSSGNPTTLALPDTSPSSSNFEIVGDVSNLNASTLTDLTVIGSITDCKTTGTTAIIRQWHHTLDTQQLLDADSGGDDDLKLERPALDNALELMTG